MFLTQRNTKSNGAGWIGTQRFFAFSRTRATERGGGDGMLSRAPRHGAAARWGHRALPQRDRKAMRRCGAMRTSRPTATGHGHYARLRGARGGRGARSVAARSIMGKMTDSSAFAFVFDFLFVAKFADDFRFYLFFLTISDISLYTSQVFRNSIRFDSFKVII